METLIAEGKGLEEWSVRTKRRRARIAPCSNASNDVSLTNSLVDCALLIISLALLFLWVTASFHQGTPNAVKEPHLPTGIVSLPLLTFSDSISPSKVSLILSRSNLAIDSCSDTSNKQDPIKDCHHIERSSG